MTQRESDDEKRPREEDGGDKARIETDIDETRAAIGEDIKALGERLSPANLREGAKIVMRDAKDEAKELLREVKEEAVGSLREAKDGAVESLRSAKDSAMATVNEVIDEVGQQARSAGHKTSSFVTANAVPLALIGMGVGWLTLSMRSASAMSSRTTTPPTMSGTSRPRASLVDRATDEIRGAADHARTRAAELTHEAADRGRELTADVRERANELTHEVADRGRELKNDARDQARVVQERAMTYAEESPIALGAIIMAAGVGVGLALPASPIEQRVVREVGGDFVEDAKRAARQVGSTAATTAKSIGTSLTENIRAE